MDSIIRSARMEQGQPRVLGQSVAPAKAEAVQVGSAPAAQRTPTPEEIRAALRDEVEAELRRELAEDTARAFAEERVRGRKEGFEEGYAEGIEQAIQDAATARAEERELVSMELSRISDAITQALDTLNSSLDMLAFEAVRRILGEHALERKAIEGAVSSVLADIRAQGTLTVRLHPGELSRLQGTEPDETFHLSGRNLQFVADESLSHGGCIIDSEAGRFDGAFDTQLKQLHAALTTARRMTENASDA